MSDSPPSDSRPRAKAIAITLAVLVGVPLALWYGFREPAERLATQILEQALPSGVEVGRIEVNSPTSISLVDVRRGDMTADEIKLTFSGVTALTDGVAAGLEQVEIIRPVIRLDSGDEEAPRAPLELLGALEAQVRGVSAGPGAGRGGALRQASQVVITEGAVHAGGEAIVDGVKAVLTPGPGGASARIEAARLFLEGAPWHLEGAFRAVDASSVHSFRLSATRGEAAVRISGAAGAEEADVVVEAAGVNLAELGRGLLPDQDPLLLAGLELLGTAEGSIRFAGPVADPAIEGEFTASGAPGEGEAWRVDVSGGRGGPISAGLSIDDEAGERMEAEYDPEDGTLRLTGEDVPVELLARVASRLFVPGLPWAELTGRADVDVTVTAPKGGWENGSVSGEIVVPWARFRNLPLADGKFRLAPAAGGGVSLTGTAAAGNGSVELDAVWDPVERDFRVEGSLERFPVELLAGEAGVAGAQGEATGPFLLEGGRSSWRATLDLALAGVAYGAARLEGGRLTLDVGSHPTEDEAGGEACPRCVFGAGRLSGDLGAKGKSTLKPVEVSVEFGGDRVALAAHPVSTSTGMAEAGGSAALVEGEWLLDLWANGDALWYEDEGLKALVGFEISMSGPAAAPVVAGSVRAAEGDVDLLRLPGFFPRGVEASGTRRAFGPGLFNPRLDLAIEIAAANVAAGEFLDVEAAGTLRLTGRLADPQLLGEVALLRGGFRLSEAEFAAEEGAVRFGAGEPPLIAIAGTRPSERAMIAASVEGRAGDIAIRLSSDPPLARQEILALLGAPAGADLGERWNELARSLGELAGAAPQRAGGLAAAAP